MQDPEGLVDLTDEQPEAGELDAPVLLHALNGFVDAGHAGRLAAEHLLTSLESRVLARLDVDQLLDYRARRPPMTFVEDHWQDYDAPRLEVNLVKDRQGRGFLMLTGPEPDVQWERFVAAAVSLVRRYEVRLSVGMHAIPMAVPHTRPIGVTAHATRPQIVSADNPWVGRVQVPGNAAALFELRLGQAGLDAAGFAVHVPHYLAQTDYPDAAAKLVEEVSVLTGLDLDTGALVEEGARVRGLVADQIGEQPEVAAIVTSLEEQYDAFVAGRGRSLLAADTAELPTADELGAELERFLSEENDRRGRGDD